MGVGVGVSVGLGVMLGLGVTVSVGEGVLLGVTVDVMVKLGVIVVPGIVDEEVCREQADRITTATKKYMPICLLLCNGEKRVVVIDLPIADAEDVTAVAYRSLR